MTSFRTAHNKDIVLRQISTEAQQRAELRGIRFVDFELDTDASPTLGLREIEFDGFGATPANVSYGDVIPEVLTDKETWFTSVFRRTKVGEFETIELDEIPDGEGVVLAEPNFVELVSLFGSGNAGELFLKAQEIARRQFAAPTRLKGWRLTIARPHPIQCDGLVASVEVRSRSDPQPGTGFEMTVITGDDNAPELFFGKSLTRKRRGGYRKRLDDKQDAREREGVND